MVSWWRETGSNETRHHSAATTAFRVLSGLMLPTVATQFFLAGAGVFARQAGDSGQIWLNVHASLGFCIAALALLLAISVVACRVGKPVLPMTVTLVALTGIAEPVLAIFGADDNALFGGAHALVGAAVAVLSGMIFVRGRGR